ncbi:DUF4303 domain-containing protein [Paenibacillus sp. ACRRX]|uniref:DUF4303 domain-containing protein n=1 Tax=unclassified Paenibacillus TaxID=185978 RepID=UPI001EF4D192|nr:MULTISPECIES: DUF4303 domain-containing protein [unclassified Paenibacillus]MCG7409229.1 DUF4303 domain-containing protein [Paenibacillus sp. ACRRX]MDK8181779.1 DUF4303 domain-containing protein [Paenibacillus sp. UMB4589-SE434]
MKSDFDFVLLKQEIKDAAVQAFSEIYNNNPHNPIISFALYSDEGAMTVCPSMNTIQHLNHAVKEEPDQALYYKYEPAEWAFEAQGADQAFESICTKLRNYILNAEESDDDNDASFVSFRDTLYDTCIEVLEELVRANFFSNISKNDIIVLFSVTDYEFDRNSSLKMISRLNSAPVIKEYTAWLEEWCD